MNGLMLDNDCSIARYCKPSTLSKKDGMPMPSAFELRHGEKYLSVNWLEFFAIDNPDDAVKEIRNALQAKGFRIKPTGKFFILVVQEVKDAGRESGRDLRVKHMPNQLDKSYAGIFGYANSDGRTRARLAFAVRRTRRAYPGLESHG